MATLKSARRITDTQLIGLSILLATVIFIVDLLTPLGVALCVSYTAVVLLALFGTKRQYFIVFALAASALTVAGLFFSPPGGELWKVLTNRFLTLFTIWVTAIIGFQCKRLEQELRERGERFEQFVDERTQSLKKEVEERQRAQKAMEGRNMAVISIALDVEEAWKTAKISRDYVDSIVRSMADMLVVLTGEGKIETVNQSTSSLLGYRDEELIGKDVTVVFTEEEEEGTSAFGGVGLQKLIQAGSIQDKGTSWKTKTGEKIPVSLSGSVLRDKTGKFLGAVIIARDITERKRAEEQIAAKNKELEMLLYVTSHDLGEPLRSIQNFSQMVLDEQGGRLDEEGQDLLRRVLKGGVRMNLLLNDILTLSRVRRITPSTEEVKGEVIVREVLDELETTIEETKAKVQVAQDLPRLLADRIWATQALTNLVSNALKFTKLGKHPEVEIAAYRPAPGNADGEGFVVRDRGPGVAPEHAERIFELFQRAVGQEVAGTGAGLAIVQAVAERHGGRAWVRPRGGGGSEFIVTFGKKSERRTI